DKRYVYRYLISSSPVLPPFEHGLARHVTNPIEVNMLKSAASRFIGTHDFAGFAANHGKAENDTVRTIHSVKVRQTGPCLTIDFDGNGFLYKMVRLIVGSLVQCGTSRSTQEEILE